MRVSTSCTPRLYIVCGFIEGHDRLFNDYFVENLVYPYDRFRRRFRMGCAIFLHIQFAVEAHEPYFQQKMDAAGKLRLSSLEKITAAFRMLAYGVSANLLDDDDIARLLAIDESHGFLEILGSIDCMHSKWKNCPTAWKGQFTGHIHEPTLILEVVASLDISKGCTCRKDVECAFNVLQTRFTIVRGPARYFKCSTLHDIMLACIILHNIIVEDERHLHVQPDITNMYDQAEDGPSMSVLEHLRTREFRDFVEQYIRIQDKEIHTQLQADLVKHWNIHSNA
ncbi:uncharacterized protein LOC120000630 [Tripterygium wilfordii]|uniref:uncharacterized protein LOC120000630 n=1 Tax=Tripterygium wilfordii TaxID=458696 RepID=UPI0018F84739|nr:uncharacterized protein LOC120000630 [Tripterygium wilfordii]